MTEWQVVPKEPTEEMIAAWRKLAVDVLLNQMETGRKTGEERIASYYKGMLAAAPKPEPTVWYNTRNGDTESMHNSVMGDNWIPLYALKET